MTTLIDLDVTILRETERAVLVGTPDLTEPTWLPLSLIEINIRRGSEAEITLPRWMAEERGMA